MQNKKANKRVNKITAQQKEVCKSNHMKKGLPSKTIEAKPNK